MASILSLGPRLFRTRNPARDAGTDMDRLMTVRRAIADALLSANRERQGLQQRVDVYYAQATNLIDNSAEYGARSSQDEQSISEAERHAEAATARIRRIEVQIEKLSEMLATLDATLGGNAA